jgi:hypothetical protein
MTTPEQLRRRRCLGLRIALLFAVILIVYNRGDWALVGVLAGGALIAIVAYWRDCRASAMNSARTDTHRRNS